MRIHEKQQDGFGLAGVLIAFAVVAVVCGVGWVVFNSQGSDSSVNESTSSQSSQEPVSDEASTSGTVVTTGDSEFGEILFDDNNQAIYIWEVEESEQPLCYDDCADAWPPVLTSAEPQANGGVDEELLGTTNRRDGSTQVTYNGHPLYYYAHEGPGEVRCHNVSTHGGLWWVIKPNGDRVD